MKTIKDVLWYVLSAVFGQGLFFLMLPLWTRILREEEFALIGILRTVEGIGIAFLVLGFGGAGTRFFEEAKSAREYAGFFTSCLASGALIGLCVVALFCGTVFFFPGMLAPLPPLMVVVVAISVYLTALPESLVFGSWVAATRASACAWFKISNAFVSTLLQLAFVLGSEDRLQGWVSGYFFGAIYISSASIYFSWRERWLGGEIERRHVNYALAFGLPLVPHVLFHWLLRASDRIILLKLVRVESLAHYTLASSLSTGIAMIVNALGQAWAPRFYRLLGKGGEDTKVRAYYYVLIYVIGMLAILACAGLALVGEFAFGKKYSLSWNYFVPLAGAGLFLAIYQYFVGFLFYEKRTKLIPLVTGGAAILNVALNLLLVPIYGAVSAAYTTFVCYGVMAFSAYAISARVRCLRFHALPTFAWCAVVLVSSYFVVISYDGLAAVGIGVSIIACAAVIGATVLGIKTHGAVIRAALRRRAVS